MVSYVMVFETLGGMVVHGTFESYNDDYAW